MQKERKRKFLVNDASVLAGHDGFPIVHGYIADQGCRVEVRTFGSFAFLVVQGAPEHPTPHRFEYPIPLEDAQEMLEYHCAARIVSKTRHLVPYGDEVFEIDLFGGKLNGLIVAEVPASFGGQAGDLPPWVGSEVTDNPNFDDFALAQVQGAPIDAPQGGGDCSSP